MYSDYRIHHQEVRIEDVTLRRGLWKHRLSSFHANAALPLVKGGVITMRESRWTRLAVFVLSAIIAWLICNIFSRRES